MTPIRAGTACTLALLLIGAGPLRAAAGAADVEAEEIVTAPVVLDGVRLLRARGLSHLPADERARRIADRIATVAADASFDSATVRAAEGEVGTEILAGSRRLMVVTDADADAERVARVALAATFRDAIHEAIDRYRADRTPAALLRGTLATLAIAAVLAAMLVILFTAGGRLTARLDRRLQRQIRPLEFKSFRLLDAEQIWRASHAVLQAIRVLLMVVACYFALALSLRRFAATRGASNHLLSWVLNPIASAGRSIAGSIPNLIFLAILIVVARWALRAARLFFEGLEKGTLTMQGFDRAWAAPTYRLVRIVVIAFALIVAYPYIPGSSSEAFKAISIFGGILFSLGSSSIIASVIAGYAMTYRRTFRMGDRVKIGDVVGDVVQTGVLVTRVRTPKGEEAVIPNSQILQQDVVNYSTYAREGKLILHTRVGIGYEVPWRQVEGMLLLAADRTRGVLREPRPFVLQRELADFCVNYELNVYCGDASAMLALYSELHRNVLDAFNEYGVQIMTPAYEGDPAEPKIVPRDRWYDAPARMEPNGGATVARSSLP